MGAIAGMARSYRGTPIPAGANYASPRISPSPPRH